MVVKFGTLDISGQGRNLEIGQTADEIDVTTYGSDDKEYIVGMIERDGSLEVLDDSGSSAIRIALQPGSTNSLVWFPIGTASGNPKFSVGTAVVKEQNLSYPYDDAVMLNTNIRLSGAVVEGTANSVGL
jgi:hypothetical protein